MNRHPSNNPLNPIPRKSLAIQLTWVSILMVTLALVAVGTGLIFIADRTQRDNAFRLQQQTAEQVSQLISSYMVGAVDRLVFFSKNAPLPSLSPERRRTALENLLISSLPLYSQVSILDKEGNELSKISRFHTFLPKELTNQAQNPAFAMAVRGGNYIGPVAFWGDTGLLSVPIALPIKTPTAEVAGVIIAVVNVNHLWKDVARIKIGQSGYAYLVDMKGRFVAYQKLAEVLKRYGEDMNRMPPVSEFVIRRQDGTGHVQEYQGLVNEKVIGVYASIKGTNWAILVEQPTREAYASISKMKRYLVGLMLLCIGLAGGLGFFVSRRLIGPIRTLTAAAQRFGTGDLETEFIDVKRQDEVGVLSHAFRRMQKELQRDINERKKSEDALRNEKEFTETALNAQQDTFFLFEPDTGRAIRWNRAFNDITGYTDEEIAGMTALYSYYSPDDQERAAAFVQEVLKTGSGTLEVELICKNGRKVPTEYKVSVINGEEGASKYIISIGRDVTERKRAEGALRESEEKYRMLVETANDAIFVAQDGVSKFANRKAEELTGYSTEELLQVSFVDFIHPDDRAKVIDRHRRRLMGEKPTSTYTLRIINKSGVEKTVQLNAVLIQWKDRPATLNFVRDITQQTKLEAQLQQAQKMEAVGTLTGGIAHDFNNILGIIVGNTELALNDVPEWNPAHYNLKEIKTAGLRASGIVKQLLNFSRKTEQELKPIGLTTVIKDALNLLRSTIPTTIEIRKNMPATDETILADPIQIHQVMMNLCINASQEMVQTGGILEISVDSVTLDEDDANKYPDLTQGHYVKVTVSDTGPGIDLEIIDRIFDPYFTTKEVGKGSGMGLAVVHGIIKNHSGSIIVDSQAGKGTTFTILFPVATEKPEIEFETINKLPFGTESILLVDDEKAIANTTGQMLERLGYTVQTKTDPVEALELFKAKPDRFDLVITDMTMPNMTGVNLSEKLKAVRFDIPVIICTGYSSLIDEEKAEELGITAYVMKPIVMSDIAQIVRKVLNSNGNSV